MACVIKKNGKYMSGHGSAALRCRFTWSADINEARRFAVAAQAEGLLQQTRGALVAVPSTRKELKEAGRFAMLARERGSRHGELK